jgi:putative acetyltransferase
VRSAFFVLGFSLSTRRAKVAGTILIRAREPQDLAAITEIMNCPSVIAGTLRLPFTSTEQEQERLAQHQANVHSLVAEIDGQVVGTLGLHVMPNPRRRHCAGLGMAVHDDFQGQGVGSALLAAAIDLADNWLGLHRLELHVYPDNTAGIRLYEKFSFVAEGTARDFAYRNGAYVDAVAMARLRRDAVDDMADHGGEEEGADPD